MAEPARRVTFRTLSLGVCLTLLGCPDAPPQSTSKGPFPSQNTAHAVVQAPHDTPAVARLRDIAGEAGIEFVNRNDEEAGVFSILESVGGGAALFDYDVDGCLDVAFAGGGRFDEGDTVSGLPTGVFRQTAPLRFISVGDETGLSTCPHYSHGINVGDFNSDGMPDVLVTGYGGLQLFLNLGDGTFELIEDAGLSDSLWSSSSAWGDLNGDGHLDLFVVHYVDWSFENNPECVATNGQRDVCSPRRFQGLTDVLYLSDGEGAFRDASSECGLVAGGNGLGVLLADFDLDGDLDVYVTNDVTPNFLYENDGTGHLNELAIPRGAGLSDRGNPDGSMGVDLGDMDGDCVPEVVVANYENDTFALYRNLGDLHFLHISNISGISAIGSNYVGWGTLFADLDRDGDEDVFVVNGHVVHHPPAAPLLQLPIVFENQERRRFVNIARKLGGYCGVPHMARGSARGDVDNDGRIDFAVSHVNEPVALVHNEFDDQNHWVSLKLVGRSANRDAIGGYIVLHTPGGDQVRMIRGGGSYASTSDPRMFFGLGDDPTIESADLHWPNGTVQTVTGLRADTQWVIFEGATPIALTRRDGS